MEHAFPSLGAGLAHLILLKSATRPDPDQIQNVKMAAGWRQLKFYFRIDVRDCV
jgi:hypothetical protein